MASFGIEIVAQDKPNSLYISSLDKACFLSSNRFSKNKFKYLLFLENIFALSRTSASRT